MMKIYKILFFSTTVMGTLITISSNSWLGMWMGLEINLLSIIPLMNNSSNPRSSEASLKYFITQALASTIILISIMIFNVEMASNSNLLMNKFNLMMSSALLMKAGSSPFHFWFPEVMEGLDWFTANLMLTWQKISPLVMLSYLIEMNMFWMIILLSCVFTSGIMGINQTSMRKIMAFSSINHLGWMIAAMIWSEQIWMWYFIIYSIINIILCMTFLNLNIYHINQMLSTMNENIELKMFFSMNFLSLGGIPPFIGFLPKWLTVQIMIKNEMIMMSYLMIILTLITIYFYLRLAMLPMSIQLTSSKMFMMNKIKQKKFMITNSIVMISLIMSTMILNWI